MTPLEIEYIWVLKHFEKCNLCEFPKMVNSSAVLFVAKLRIGGPRACAYPRCNVERWWSWFSSINLAGIVCRNITYDNHVEKIFCMIYVYIYIYMILYYIISYMRFHCFSYVKSAKVYLKIWGLAFFVVFKTSLKGHSFETYLNFILFSWLHLFNNLQY